MSSAHNTASFRNSCVVQPRNPKTKRPATSLERESLEFANRISSGTHISNAQLSQTPKEVLNSSLLNDYYTPDLKDFEGKYRQINHRVSTEAEEKGSERLHQTSQVDLKNLINDDDKFFSHLQALKAENKKTLKSLERLYSMTLDTSKDTFISETNRDTSRGTNYRKSEKNTNSKSRKSNKNHKPVDDFNTSIEECRKSFLMASFNSQMDRSNGYIKSGSDIDLGTCHSTVEEQKSPRVQMKPAVLEG